MFHQHPAFQIEATYDSKAYVVRLQGDLDLAKCSELELALAEAERTQAPQISLDLEELTFIDSRGLSVLLSSGRRSEASGDRLRMTHGKGQVARMFGLTGVDATLPFTNARV